jgi:hypothetical protein
MKFVSETAGIAKLEQIRQEFAEEVLELYEHRAKPCSLCETPGACCLDEHFVNVRVTRLEGRAIGRRLAELPAILREKVLLRAEEAIERHRLDEKTDPTTTYACPLFEKGIGCLVHDAAKPLPCIAHACYEREEDLPPDELLTEREIRIAELNRRVYGRTEAPLPIPLVIASPELS